MKKSLFLVGLGLFIWSNKIAFQEDEMSAEAQSFDNWMRANDSERVEICREESEKVFSSLQEAVDAVNFTIKYPEKLENEELLGIFISHSNMLTLLFANGFYITQRESANVPDYSSFIVQSKDDVIKGKLKATQVPKLINVHKCTGMGCEPGIHGFGSYTEPRPGFAEWYEDSVIYTIFGDVTSLATLVDIACSMKDVVEKTPNKNS